MSYVVTLAGYVPGIRFDGLPWTQAQIGEAATENGPFTTIDTITLTPVDADPTQPQTRNLTTQHATLPSGWYLVTFLDAAGHQEPTEPVPYPATIVKTGAWSYSGDPTASDKDAVRFELQDVDSTAQLVNDAEINYALITECGTATPGDQASWLAAAAHCCEALVRRFSAQADTVIGDLETDYTKQAAGYAERAKELRARAQGMRAAPYAGGLSLSEKQNRADDTDAVQPAFSRGQFDTPYAPTLPFGPDPLHTTP